jgi:carboxyl-terminal processing protease
MFRCKKIISFIAIGLLLVFAPPAWAQSSVEEVRELVQDYYVDVPPAGIMQARTVDELLEMIGDPHCNYFTREEYEEFLQSLDQKFCGIGIHMDMVPAGVKVVSVIKGTPAEKAGIKSGDIIIRAGDENLKGLTPEQATALLRGAAGSQVSLAIQRNDSTFQVKIVREEIEVPTVSSKVLNNGQTGYIDIDSFGTDTAEEFGSETLNLQNAGVKNWIIDLRDNTGGYLETAFELAGYFIGEKPVINVKERDYSEVCSGIKQNITVKGPVAVLINENSASASEILAGALQDYHRALVLGQKSYGKGTVQEIFRLSGGDMLKLTIARFYSPKGDVIDHIGIAPDLAVNEKNDALLLAQSLLGGKPVEYPEIEGIAADLPFSLVLAEKYNAADMTMIQCDNGNVVPVQVKADRNGKLIVIPQAILQSGAEYWLLTGSTEPGQGLVKVRVMGVLPPALTTAPKAGP